MRRTPSSNVGREQRGGARPQTTGTTLRPLNKENSSTLDDKYHRVLEENNALKKERNALDEKLKELKTKFRRLTRDLKPDANGDYVLPQGSVVPSRNDSVLVAAPTPPAHPQQAEYDSWQRDRQRLEERLRVTTAQLEYAIKTQHQPQHQAQAHAADTNSTALASQVDVLRQQLYSAQQRSSDDERRISSLQKERDALHHEIQGLQTRLLAVEGGTAAGSHSNPAIDHHRHQIQELLSDLQKNRDQQLTDMHTIDSLTRERDGLKLRLRMVEDEASLAAATGANSQPDPMSMTSLHDLQRALAEAKTQMTVLTNRYNFSTGQVDALKRECERLVDDLRSINNQHAEVKKNMFQMEHEKMALQVKCEKVTDLESSLQHKSEELLKNEKELLRLIDRLQTCSRETEMQVRREFTDRISELENLRDKAEQDRRANEREMLNLKLQVGDVTRRLENAQHDAQLYSKEVARLEAEKKELMDRVALGGYTSVGMDMNDDVQRAVAMASMRSRTQNVSGAQQTGETMYTNHNKTTAPNNMSNVTGAAQDVLNMWEGMEWSDDWELAKLREAMSTAALDLELAEQRCSQVEKALSEKNEMLVGISGERDELLNENIELRHRISGVQTALARQQIRKLQEAYDNEAARGSANNIHLTIDRIACDPVYQQCDDGSTYAPTLFFTVDGIPNFSTLISDTFYSLEENLSVKFLFEGLEASFVNMQSVQSLQLVLQLHQAFGEESAIVAEATLSGGRLLHCRFDGTLSEALPLFSTDGEKMGHVHITVEAPNLLIPLILARPIVSPITPEHIRAALISFRSVVALRVQIFRASNLVGGVSPYVFYTSTSPHGVTFIKDTVVTSSNRVQTTDPVFDILPQDHSIVLDAEFIRFVHDGKLSIVLFDHQAQDVESNLGMAVIPLKEMLVSPAAMISRTEPLHPQGTVEIGISWVRSIEPQ